nr:transposase [Modestobacter excelsi]
MASSRHQQRGHDQRGALLRVRGLSPRPAPGEVGPATHGRIKRVTRSNRHGQHGGLDAVMPGPHLVSSLLKRWTAGTLHYRISRQHLPYYLDAFTFRFNRRTSRARGMLFYRLLQQAVDTDPHPLKELIGG